MAVKAAKTAPVKNAKRAAAKTTKTPAAKNARRPAAKTTKTAPAKDTRPAKTAARRDDFGAGIDGFLAKQSGPILALVNELRAVIEAAAPDAVPALKWGMPIYAIGKAMVCGIGAHKAHVNLILSGPPGTFADRGGQLVGEGKTGRHLKLAPGDAVPAKAVTGWVKTAAKLARES